MRELVREVGDDRALPVGDGRLRESRALAHPRMKPVRGDHELGAQRVARLERDLNSVVELEVYVDGADEVNRALAMVKGGGGALTREKIVAAASKKFVCLIHDTKLVDVLGRFPLPVEVIPMARSYVARRLVTLGGQPVWRQGIVTDNGNVILDVHNLRIVDPVTLEREIDGIAGVVSVGLFARRGADVLIVAGDSGIRRL